MIEKQWFRRGRSGPAWGCCAGVVVAVGAMTLSGTVAANAQSLTPPTLSPTVVVVQAAVTIPPTLPLTPAPPGSLSAPTTAASATVTTKPVGAVSRYSDPLSDMASAALDALRNGSAGGTTQSFSAVPPGAVATAPVTLVRAAPSAQPSASATVAATGDTPWSAVVIDTAQLSEYLSGVAVSMPINPSVSAALAALPTEPSARYSATLHALAVIVAARTKVDVAGLEAAWARTEPRRMRTILTAMAQVGTMYRSAGNQPGGFDCSGLTSYAWAQAGVKIPRTSGDQINAAALRSPDQVQPGDIVWHPGHVGLTLGYGDAMVDSPQTGRPVEVTRWGRAQRWGSPV